MKKKPRIRRNADIVEEVLAVKGLTCNILTQAIYHLRARAGLCAHSGCRRKVYRGNHCEPHREVHIEAAYKSKNKRTPLPELRRMVREYLSAARPSAVPIRRAGAGG